MVRMWHLAVLGIAILMGSHQGLASGELSSAPAQNDAKDTDDLGKMIYVKGTHKPATWVPIYPDYCDNKYSHYAKIQITQHPGGATTAACFVRNQLESETNWEETYLRSLKDPKNSQLSPALVTRNAYKEIENVEKISCPTEMPVMRITGLEGNKINYFCSTQMFPELEVCVHRNYNTIKKDRIVVGDRFETVTEVQCNQPLCPAGYHFSSMSAYVPFDLFDKRLRVPVECVNCPQGFFDFEVTQTATRYRGSDEITCGVWEKFYQKPDDQARVTAH